MYNIIINYIFLYSWKYMELHLLNVVMVCYYRVTIIDNINPHIIVE